MTNVRVRAILPMEDGIVFIHRIKKVNDCVKEFYVLPGGGSEGKETIEETLDRELKEELGITANIVKIIYKIIDDKATQFFILCNYKDGVIGTGDGPEFNSEEYKDRGKYIPEIVKFKDLSCTNVVPVEFKKQLLIDLEKDDIYNIEYKEIVVDETIVM